MKTVAHFVRKSSQLNSSFIRNQILNHLGYKPVIVYLYDSEDKDYRFSYFDENDIPILNLKIKFSHNIKGLFFYTFIKIISQDAVLKINNFLKDNKVDIVHFHYGSDTGIYYPFLKQTYLPSVTSFYGYDAFSFPKKYFGIGRVYLKRRVFSTVNYVLAMSVEMKRDLLKAGCPDNSVIIHYHGVPDLFPGFRKNNYKNKTHIQLLIISYLDPVKGHIFLLRAMRRAIDMGMEKLKLSIFGDGHYRYKIEQEIKRLNLKNYVNLHGSVPYGSSEFKRALKNADIFIHPSVTTKEDKEGIPGAIVEAMFASLPVISTYHGGIPHVIFHNETGILVREWDVNGLAEGIIKLSSNEKLRAKLGRGARESALRHLALLNKQVELEKIYDNIINKAYWNN